MFREDLIIAVLLTFCITIALFGIIPTSGQGAGDYDPWCDINDDGIIDMRDIGGAAIKFGASGNSIKNVTIAGRVTKLIELAEGVSVPDMGMWDSGYITIDGYSKVSVHVIMDVSTNRITLEAPSGWSSDYLIESIEDFQQWSKTYDVMHRQLRIRIWNLAVNSATLYVDIYLVA